MTQKKSPPVSINKSIMKQIKSGKVKMRPKLYFLAGSLLLGLGLAATIITALFFTAITTHNLRIYMPQHFLQFGRLGVVSFLSLIPWVPILFSLIGIIGGLTLIKKFDISYKKSFASIVISITFAVLILAIFVDRFGINNQLQQIAPLRHFYLQQFVDQDYAIGEIIAVDLNTLKVTSPEGYSYDVVWTETTMLPKGSNFTPGISIKAVGTWEGATFSATGIFPGKFPTPAALKDPAIRKEIHNRMLNRLYRSLSTQRTK